MSELSASMWNRQEFSGRARTGTEVIISMRTSHIIKAPTEVFVKKDTMKDLLTIFSDIVMVQFNRKNGAAETIRGWWCPPCRSVQCISRRVEAYQKFQSR